MLLQFILLSGYLKMNTTKHFNNFSKKYINFKKLNINLIFINSKNKRIQSFPAPMIQDLGKEL